MAGEAEVRVHLIARDQFLAERLKLSFSRLPDFRLTISAHFSFRIPCDVLVLPASDLPGDKAFRFHSPCIAYGSVRELRAAFLAGCDDYLRDPWEPEELVCRVYRVLRQVREKKDPAWGRVVLRNMKIVGDAGEVSLSYPESLLAEVLLRNPDQVVPRPVLYYALWGKQARPQSRALDMHISTLRKKLVSLFPEIRITACRGVGYRLEAGSSSQTTAVP